MFNGRRQPSRGGTSRMMREYQVRICERLGVKFPEPTRQKRHYLRCPRDVRFPSVSDKIAALRQPSLGATTGLMHRNIFGGHAARSTCISISLRSIPKSIDGEIAGVNDVVTGAPPQNGQCRSVCHRLLVKMKPADWAASGRTVLGGTAPAYQENADRQGHGQQAVSPCHRPRIGKGFRGLLPDDEKPPP